MAVEPLLDNDLEITTIQQPLLSNESAPKHVSTAIREYGNNDRRVFFAFRAEIL
jgi:hypothetical protein